MIYLLVLISKILIIFLTILSYFFIIPFFFGAPYEPSRGKALINIIKFTDVKKGDKIAELGSGNGVVCIQLAKNGAEVHGFEINPLLVWISKRKIKKLGLQNRVFIHWRNFWKEDLGKYNKIVLFQFKTIMRRLERKFKKELKPKTKIISHWWRIPGWKIKKKIGRIYLYKV